MIAKRAFDVAASGMALVLLFPFFAACAIAIKFDSKGPVFYCQQRVGRRGTLFLIYKFRTMIWQPNAPGMALTVGRDIRVTRVGGLLRKYKLDELPQLINVLRGEMSIVGPRPEVPEYVAHYTKLDRDIILSARPGITDEGSLKFFAEADLIGQMNDPEEFYISTILPQKIEMYKLYVNQRSMLLDLKIIFRTLSRAIFGKVE